MRQDLSSQILSNIASVGQHSILQFHANRRPAIHLESLYEKLKDYQPSVDYSHHLARINKALDLPKPSQNPEDVPRLRSRVPGFWKTILGQHGSPNSESVALTRLLTSHEAAMEINTPRGLLLHGEVGTGKSMLIDLFAECLPTNRKRRWHYNTFMLQMISLLEKYRVEDRNSAGGEYSLLRLARNLIYESPILFLDEFQLPDRMAAKTLSNLMTIFFQLGGVLIATSNRLPNELAKAAGQYPPQPPTLKNGRATKYGSSNVSTRFPGDTEFVGFLDLLKARCEVWQFESKTDYRREGVSSSKTQTDSPSLELPILTFPTATAEMSQLPEDENAESAEVPRHYVLVSPPQPAETDSVIPGDILLAEAASLLPSLVLEEVLFSSVKVFGRTVPVPRIHNGTSIWTFDELCTARYGPADYITLASTFHTFVILNIPILTAPLKNEARRFITLLDALYEAKCNLFISAAATPDNLFFPDLRSKAIQSGNQEDAFTLDADALHAETFAEMHQDMTSPFRPNISSYNEGILAHDALEDDPPNKILREALPGLSEMERLERLGSRPNFTDTSYFTGEDEKFAYKRAVSRLWEMCGEKWWSRKGWSPLPVASRHWEQSHDDRLKEAAIEYNRSKEIASSTSSEEALGGNREVNEAEDEVLFRHGASPFRTQPGPPPKFREDHVWGVLKWPKKAGAWGQGVEGLKNRDKDKR